MISKQECTTSAGYILHKSTAATVHSCAKQGYDDMKSTGSEDVSN